MFRQHTLLLHVATQMSDKACHRKLTRLASVLNLSRDCERANSTAQQLRGTYHCLDGNLQQAHHLAYTRLIADCPAMLIVTNKSESSRAPKSYVQCA